MFAQIRPFSLTIIAVLTLGFAWGQQPNQRKQGDASRIETKANASTTGTANGAIKGTVKDHGTGEVLADAYVVVLNTEFGAMTDAEGVYEIADLTAGSYTLVIQYMGYLDDTVANIEVTAGAFTQVDVAMRSEGITLQSITVKAERVAVTNNVALVADIKTSSVIETGVSQQQIAQSQARNAGDVVKSMPGITVLDGSFVNIRGLNERYNVVMLNNVIAPSTESDKRAFSFNTVPSSMLDRMVVYRSPSPEMYADMGGGIVRIYTKNVPEVNEVTASLEGSYRSGTTGQTVLNHQRPGLYALGFYNGASDVPATLPAVGTIINDNYSLAERASFGRQLDNDWSMAQNSVTPDLRASLGYGTRFKLGKDKGMTLGTSTTLRYSNTSTYYTLNRTNYQSIDKLFFKWEDNNYSHNIATGILHNWIFILNPDHKIEFKNLFNQNATTQTVVRQGVNFLDETQSLEELRYSQYYETRTIYSGQLIGKHDLTRLKTTLEWTGAYNYGRKNIPNWRQASGSRDYLSGNDFNFTNTNNSSLQRASHFWADNVEDALIGQVNLKTKFNVAKRESKLLYGAYVEQRARTFDSRAFALQYQPGPLVYERFPLEVAEKDKYNTDLLGYAFGEDKFSGAGGQSIIEITKPSDSYTAKLDLWAAYAALDLPVGPKMKLYAGARYESSTQKLNSLLGDSKIEVSNPFDVLMPTATATYRFNDKHTLRGSYSRTLNRPELRELAPFQFYNFDFDVTVEGNPKLKTATIDHYEFRYEFYPALAELVTIGGFYKNFTNPIESALEPNSQFGTFYFLNADMATSIGAELEIRKNLGFLWKKMNNLSLVGNVAIIKSEVKFNDQATVNAQGESKRFLQGQSPYVVNAGLFYQNDAKGLNISAQYNVVGPSIAIVGNVNQPNIYTTPRQMVDLTLSKNLNKWLVMTLGVQNLLNSEVRLMQDTNRDGKVLRAEGKDNAILNYYEQPYFTLGLRVKLNVTKPAK